MQIHTHTMLQYCLENRGKRRYTIILGLDTSTTSTGYCVMKDDKIISYGVIKPPKGLDTLDRVIYIVDEVKSILKAKSVEYVGIEELVTFRNANTTRMLQGLITILEVEMRRREIPCELIRPSVWRKGIIKGKDRKELKKASKDYIEKEYGLKVSDDESDAILITKKLKEMIDNDSRKNQ